MSASREKRTRQDVAPQGPNEKLLQQQAQAKKDRSHNIVYAVVGVAVAAVIVALLVWNSNFFQNRSAAATINGQEYSSADVQFYYTSAQQLHSYYAMMGMSSYNYTVSPKEQMYNEAEGKTWHDYFLEQAVINLSREVALATEAEKAGHTLSEAGQADIDKNLAALEGNWVSSGYADRSAYLRASYGSAMKYETYVDILTRSALASDYANTQKASFTYEQADLDAYYAENKDTLDAFTVTQFVLQATVPTEKDADGKVIEKSEEEKTATLEAAKTEVKAAAEELKARLEAGEDAEALAEEFEDKLFSTAISEKRLGGSVNSDYAEWAFDSARKSGDVTLVEYEGTSSTTYNYCVARFDGRAKDSAPTANIRHALIGAGSAPTEAQYAEAKEKAEKLLGQWQADGATEESFAVMATANSMDPSSASNGGLMNVSTYSNYVDTFKDWSLDAARKTGDTGIVQNTGSSTKGYHIMYFVGWDDPKWMQTAENALREQDLTAWETEIFSGYTAENGAGLKYVG